MRVKVISRDGETFQRGSTRELHRLHRNRHPDAHPMERAREYKRALNSAKLEKVFAKPFVASMEHHKDAVASMATCPTSLVRMVSGAHDGQVLVWDLPRRRPIWNVARAHEGAVNAIAFDGEGERFVTCGIDKTVKMFGLDLQRMRADRRRAQRDRGGYNSDDDDGDRGAAGVGDDDDSDAEFEEYDGATTANPSILPSAKPLRQWLGKNAFTCVDHHRSLPRFVTSGARIDLWDVSRSAPINHFSWGAETVKSVKFNVVEHNIMASLGSDNTVVLYDVRQGSPTQKMVMKMRANQLAWNPMEAINFAVASEDSNVYTFDMRKLSFASCVHRGHASAVISLSYSPTGLEFATGGYDNVIRIFGSQSSNSRDVYHTRRMGHITCVQFTSDARYVLSGSDDHNVRLWKAQASMPLRHVSGSEKRKLDYSEKLKDRYKHVPEVRHILNHQHLPKKVYKMRQTSQDIEQFAKKREQNRRKHSKPGAVPFKSARAKGVRKVLD